MLWLRFLSDPSWSQRQPQRQESPVLRTFPWTLRPALERSLFPRSMQVAIRFTAVLVSSDDLVAKTQSGRAGAQPDRRAGDVPLEQREREAAALPGHSGSMAAAWGKVGGLPAPGAGGAQGQAGTAVPGGDWAP